MQLCPVRGLRSRPFAGKFAPRDQGKAANMADNTDTHQETTVHRPLKPVSKRWRKFVVVVDGTPESKVALRFAGNRASHITGGGVILFHCIRPGEFQHWMTVADRMAIEAREEAETLLDSESKKLEEVHGVRPECVIAEGEPKVELLKLLRESPDIFGLVLGCGDQGEPGPLVEYFVREGVQALNCPVFLIPGTMTFEQVDALA